MKRTITKLVLHRETVRALVDGELARVVGGEQETGCTQMTKLPSGCSAAVTPTDLGEGNR
jgi:hypothetical protein